MRSSTHKLATPWVADIPEQEYACRCGACPGTIPPRLRAVVLKLARSIDVARRVIGVPLTIVSGVRCVTSNRLAEGLPLSRHLFGDAADISCPEYTGEVLRGMFEILIKLRHIPNGGLGTCQARPDVLHYDQRPFEPSRWRT